MKPVRCGKVAWLLVAIVIGLMGCKEPDPEDLTERNIDEAMGETRERLEGVGENIEKDMEEDSSDDE